MARARLNGFVRFVCEMVCAVLRVLSCLVIEIKSSLWETVAKREIKKGCSIVYRLEMCSTVTFK